MAKTVSGPGRIGSVKAMKKSLKKSGSASVKNIPSEDSLTVRFLDDAEDFHGYYEHYVGGKYEPCVSDDCDGCNSDDPDEQRKNFRYLANAYVVDDQKVWALKMPKSLVEMLMSYHGKYKTLLDRDYELSRTGSGKNDTKYMAVPDSPTPMKTKRFESKKFDLDDVLSELAGLNEDADDDDEPVSKKKKGSKKSSAPWDDDDDDDDEPVAKKKSSAVKKKTTVKPKGKVAVKKKTVRRK